MIRRYLCLLIVGLLLTAPSAFAQLSLQLAPALQQALASSQSQSNVRGLSAAVIFPDGSMWQGVSGTSTLTPLDSLRTDMYFGIGSCSKTFTAALVLRLAAQGHFSLDDSIGRRLPLVLGFPNISPNVTIRQLLNHTGGVFNYTASAGFAQAMNNGPGTRVLAPTDMLGYAGPMRFTPGTSFEYSNTGYVLLGLLIEEVMGMPYMEAFKQELLAPLNLTDFDLGYNDSLPVGLPVAHGWTPSGVPGQLFDSWRYSRMLHFSAAHAAGAMIGTPKDLARWAQALYGGQVLDSASLADMVTPHPLSGTTRYGLGCMRTSRYNRAMWGHNGAIFGYLSTFGYVPSCGISIAVTCNDNSASGVTEIATNRLLSLAFASACNVQDVAEESAAPTLRVFPNPAEGRTAEVHYSWPRGTADATLRVYDVLGRPVRTLTLDRAATSATLPLDGLAPGLYLCRLHAGGQAGAATRLVVR